MSFFPLQGPIGQAMSIATPDRPQSVKVKKHCHHEMLSYQQILIAQQ